MELFLIREPFVLPYLDKLNATAQVATLQDGERDGVKRKGARRTGRIPIPRARTKDT